MNTYHIRFFFYDDCRVEITVKAHNTIMALAKAMDQNFDLVNWCTSPGFKVEIQYGVPK